MQSMAEMSRVLGPLAVLPLLALPASADTGQCHVVDVDFLPKSNLQIVAWVEDKQSNYVDTVFITQATGTYGLGNRPGRFDFNSGSPDHPSWPYGRRITTFPVWAHRHGVLFPEVDFQDGRENDLSHQVKDSSRENHYCRPLLHTEPAWDTGTCASTVYTDKGVLSQSKTSMYPPRQDITRQAGDSVSVDMYGALNPFDAVSQATPVGGVPAQITWPIPQTLPTGDYVIWVEVAQEFDMNDTYHYPSPTGISYGDYGLAYRGQPSVVYKVPFAVDSTNTTAVTMEYEGYGDPDGIDGVIRSPDGTITTAASRFQVVSDQNSMYRVRVVAHNESDSVPPASPTAAVVTATEPQSATIQFVAPGDDGTFGKVSGYEIRYRAGGSTITEDNFLAGGSNPATGPSPVAPGGTQVVTLDRLLPETDYSVGIRAYDKCHNTSSLAVVTFRTADRQAGTVDACFVATAAYGSLLATDVGMLRHFRDSILKSTVLGELAVETYYTFGPAVAGVVGESDLLRETARAVLAPIVRWAGTRSF
jgi:hypothetical protein